MKNVSIILSSLFLVFFLNSSFKIVSDNYLKIGSSKWDLTSAIIANESYGSKSKYELDIMSDNNNLSTAKTFIYFSITSATTTKLTDGLYSASSASLKERTPFHFNGWVKVNGNKIDIKDGSFTIQNENGVAEIHFMLKLENGDIANGHYTGNFSLVDRSKNY